MRSWEDLMQLPILESERVTSIMMLRNQHTLTPFDDLVINVQAPLMNGQMSILHYLFIDNEVGGIITSEVLYAFGAAA